MELYVKVSFWMNAVGLGLRFLLMLVADYPRTTTYSAAADSATAMLLMAFLAWSWVLVYGT